MNKIFEKHLLKQRVNAIINSEKNIFLFGEGGIGKSTIMSIINEVYLQRAQKGGKVVPLYIDVKLLDSKNEKPIENYIYKTFCGKDSDKTVLEDLFCGKKYSDYEFILLVDGYNEATSQVKNRIYYDIQQLLQDNCKFKAIVSSRIYEQNFDGDFDFIEINPLSNETIEDLIGVNIEYSLKEILKTPFFLSLYCETYKGKESYFNTNLKIRKANILDTFCKKLSEAEKKNIVFKNIKTFIIDYWLPQIAYEMVKNSAFSLESSVVKELKKIEYFESFFCGSKQEELEDLFASELFKPFRICKDFAVISEDKEHAKVSFSHQYWRDFFASKHIVNLLNLHRIDELEYIPKDEEILRFVGELFNNASGCECDFEAKRECNSSPSPIETFLQEHNLLSKKPLTAKATAKLIEIMKVSRNGKIVGDYSNLDLTETAFVNCNLPNSIFNNSLICESCFSPVQHDKPITNAAFSNNGKVLCTMDDFGFAIIQRFGYKKEKISVFLELLDECNKKLEFPEERLSFSMGLKVKFLYPINDFDFAVVFVSDNDLVMQKAEIYCSEKDIKIEIKKLNPPDVIEGATKGSELRFFEFYSTFQQDGWSVSFSEWNPYRRQFINIKKDDRIVKKISTDFLDLSVSCVVSKNKESFALISEKNAIMCNNNFECEELVNRYNEEYTAKCLYEPANLLFVFQEKILHIFDVKSMKKIQHIDLKTHIQSATITDEFLITETLSGTDLYSIECENKEIRLVFLNNLNIYWLHNVRYEKSIDMFSFVNGDSLCLWNHKTNDVWGFQQKQWGVKNKDQIRLFKVKIEEEKQNENFVTTPIFIFNEKWLIGAYDPKHHTVSLFSFNEDRNVPPNIAIDPHKYRLYLKLDFMKSLNETSVFLKMFFANNRLHSLEHFENANQFVIKSYDLETFEEALEHSFEMKEQIGHDFVSALNDGKCEVVCDYEHEDMKVVKKHKKNDFSFIDALLVNILGADFSKSVSIKEDEKIPLFKLLNKNGGFTHPDLDSNFEEVDMRIRKIFEAESN